MNPSSLVRDVRDLARDVLVPAEPRLEAEGGVPETIIQCFRDLGLFGMAIPKEFGGLGLGPLDQVRVTMELTYASVVFRSRMSTTIGLASQSILRVGTDDQRSRYLPKMASGAWTGAFALTEEQAGSDATGIQTTAVRDGSDFVLNGHKRYITNAVDADVTIVMARTGGTGRDAMSAFIVESGTPGFEPQPPVEMMGQAGSKVSEIEITECRIPTANLVGGEEGRGFATAMAGINAARLHVAATCAGQCRRLTDEALAHATTREQFGGPIAELDVVGALLADCEVDTLAATEMVLGIARRSEAGGVAHDHVAAAKYFASEALGRVADRAVQVLGGLGYVKGHAVERLYRDARLFRIFEGTSQIQRRAIARAMVKRSS